MEKLTVYEKSVPWEHTRKNPGRNKKTLDIVYELFQFRVTGGNVQSKVVRMEIKETLSNVENINGGNLQEGLCLSCPIDTGCVSGSLPKLVKVLQFVKSNPGTEISI